MTNERLAELRADAEKCMDQGEGYHPNVGARELLALVELAKAMLRSREKTREKVALLRAKKAGKPVKAAEDGRKAAKKPLQAIGQEAPPAPKMPEGVPVANTAAEMAENLAKFAKFRKRAVETPIVPPEVVSLAHKMGENLSHMKPKPIALLPQVTNLRIDIDSTKQPVPSVLPKAFLSVLDRVKLPSQIKHDPTVAQRKPKKK